MGIAHHTLQKVRKSSIVDFLSCGVSVPAAWYCSHRQLWMVTDCNFSQAMYFRTLHSFPVDCHLLSSGIARVRSTCPNNWGLCSTVGGTGHAP